MIFALSAVNVFRLVLDPGTGSLCEAHAVRQYATTFFIPPVRDDCIPPIRTDP